MLTLGSLFDGIGGWLDAAIRAGVKPVWASEIEPFPCAVTAHHYPEVLQLGDITKIDTNTLTPVDIVCAGSPCQDLSVAGKREGLAGERSGLFKKAVELVHALRNRTGKPRYFVWENVPGAFSSNKGFDFKAVIEEIIQTEIPMPSGNKWAEAGMVEWGGTSSLAWRTLDAQYWGVPQRRKRIFLVADFGGFTAGEILFVESGLSRNSAQSSRKREGTTTDAERSTGSTSGNRSIGWDAYQHHNWKTAEQFGTLTAENNNHVRGDTPLVMDNNPTGGEHDRFTSSEGLQGSLQPMVDGKQTDNVYTLDRAAFNQGKNAKYNFKISNEGIIDTLVARGPGAVAVIDDGIQDNREPSK